MGQDLELVKLPGNGFERTRDFHMFIKNLQLNIS